MAGNLRVFVREFELVKEGEKSVRKLEALKIQKPWFGYAAGYMDCWGWGARGMTRKDIRGQDVGHTLQR